MTGSTYAELFVDTEEGDDWEEPFRLLLEKIDGDMSALKGLSATSDTEQNLSVGSKAFPDLAPATAVFPKDIRARVKRRSDPNTYMLGRVTSDPVAGAVTILVDAVQGVVDDYDDWIITVDLVAALGRGTARSVSGADTQLAADHFGLVSYSGAGGDTQTLLSAADAGVGFKTTFAHDGSITSAGWTVGTLLLIPGDRVTLVSNGVAWKIESAVGYGAALRPWPVVITGTTFGIRAGYIYRVDTNAAGATVTGTIAASQPNGGLFGIDDYAKNFGTHKVTVNANSTAGDTIRGRSGSAANTYDFDFSGIGGVFARNHAATLWGML